MANPLPAPTAPTAEAPKPKRSPPSPEELCLRTFRSCWFLDKDWLISFVASAQRTKPDSPITWVEFMPKGHTHLVRSALKLVPPTKNLPLAKVKEVMFTFVLETLNGPGSSPGFFNARKAAKPKKRVRKRPGKEVQSGDDAMAVTPPSPPPAPSLPLVPGPLSPNPSGNGREDPSPPGEEQENRSSAQRLGDSSEKPIGNLDVFPQTPDTWFALNPHLRPHTPPPVLRWPRDLEAASTPVNAPTRAPSPSPSIASVLGKRHTPPPPTSPPPLVGSPVTQAPQDWRAWMDWKRTLYSQRNPGRPIPAVVTPVDIRDAAATASPALPPPSLPPTPPLPLAPAPTLLRTPPKKGKKQKKTPSPPSA